MSKNSVLALVVAAFVVGMWVGDGLRSPATAQPPAAEKPPMFQEVVVPDKDGERGSLYMIYNGPGQICPMSQWSVPLKQKVEKPAAEKPAVEKPAVEKPKTPDKPAAR